MSIKKKFEEIKREAYKWYKEHEKEFIFGSALMLGVGGTMVLQKVGNKLYEEHVVENVVNSELSKTEDGYVGLDMCRKDRFGRTYDKYNVYWKDDVAKSIGEKIIACATTPFDEL